MGGVVDDMTLAEARSALAWWLEAGVDVAVQEGPRDWLKAPAPRVKAAGEATSPPNVVQPNQETLAELQQWLASSATLPLAGPAAKRVLPHGPENAPVMLLSDAHALEDAAAGQPIGGEAWILAQRMLAAIGIDVDDAYSASLSSFHAPGARMSEQDRAACAEIARQHIRLAQPKRLLLLGEGPCQALLGKGLVAARSHIHKVEGVRTVATFHPRQLINQPSKKSMAWWDLLLLMENES
ncbi:uracil-DNA glycosylase [Sphingomonas sp. URHD0057]|uniref:uracil-DNA glycosylase n=1 Tax=Sphingomonas sp. URHD0057 TaxID=1380389 RepID=UPI0006867B98|nr:uracil-DNA glycosylase family protein [Sphingomonas sp. URHD0057]